MLKEPKEIYTADEINCAIQRIAGEIAVDFYAPDAPEFVLVGLHRQGVPLAERIAEAIRQKTGQQIAVGKLDTTMYRDDIGIRKTLPLIRETELPFDLDNARVILVDDVLSSGRTIRAALDAITYFGRPRLIRLAVLVDRGNPEYPIHADYAGFSVSEPQEYKVSVDLESDTPSVRLIPRKLITGNTGI